ncbi:MAG: 50S ribosomal protein L1 [Mycoplasmatales bacterium]|nr:50S ribosomal protein L1 [Mycoplasmatales bacterium]
MKKYSKKSIAARAKVDSSKFYTLEEGIKLAKAVAYENFDPSLDIAFKLNLDVRQADQQLRGSIPLPNGTGNSVKVLAATDDVAHQEEAKKAGAEFAVGKMELEEILKKGKFDFDIIVTDPKMMPTLGKYGKVLGPKGLMPNPKTGTVTPMVGKAVQEIKKGKANYRTEKNGIIHTIFGKKSMDDKKLLENVEVIIDRIQKLKPSAVKGVYIQSVTIATTMGPAIKIELKK